jgi:UDP-N-acetylmuramoylalanine--D-glutamate ligase
MDKAVEAAARDAEKGDTVLLSPGAASFDQFGNFNERGDYFAKIVKTREDKK